MNVTRFATVIALAVFACAPGDASSATQTNSLADPVAGPAVASSQLACQVKSVQQYPATFENVAVSPTTGLTIITQLDAKGVYQLYSVKEGTTEATCLTCIERAGAPRVDRNKPMISWHPSGQWLLVGVEEDTHANDWMPQSWQRSLLQSGMYLNIWIYRPDSDRWYQSTAFHKTASAPSDGFVGTPFSGDGKKGVWAEIIDGNIFANLFGVWRLFAADFEVSPNGTPSLTNKKDITPAGAKWVEPGNVAPDGRHLIISSDIGLKDPQGQDQWSLDLVTGEIKNLTNSPGVWDEHGLYSPSGKKVTFMSSYPYRSEPDSFKVLSLKTEFMLMDADGGHLQQLTHFNLPGYPESQAGNSVAAVAQFYGDGSMMFGTVMGPAFTKTNWVITFNGRCG